MDSERWSSNEALIKALLLIGFCTKRRHFREMWCDRRPHHVNTVVSHLFGSPTLCPEHRNRAVGHVQANTTAVILGRRGTGHPSSIFARFEWVGLWYLGVPARRCSRWKGGFDFSGWFFTWRCNCWRDGRCGPADCSDRIVSNCLLRVTGGYWYKGPWTYSSAKGSSFSQPWFHRCLLVVPPGEPRIS